MNPQSPPPAPDGTQGMVNSSYIPPAPDGTQAVASPNNPSPSILDSAASAVTNTGKGFVKGALSTLSGVDNMVSKIPGVGNWLTTPIGQTSGTNATGKTNSQVARDYEESLTHPNGAAQHVGYGGETLLEMFMGDEALKGLSMADKALAAGKAMKVIEKSPKLLKAAQIGANALRAGAVQGTQTLLRSGGDVHEAVKSGAEGAATAGILGGAFGVAGKVASKLGKGGSTAGELADLAANAPDKQTVAENIQGQLQNSKTALHQNYESNIQDFEHRLSGADIDPQTAPIAQKAEEILQRPNPEDHPSVAELKEIRGEKLDGKVRQFLENTANGKAPLTDADVEAADTANASKPNLLDATGNPIETPDVEPEGQDLPPHDAHSLIQWRQQVRALASEYEPGDVNARALNRLLWDGTSHSSAFDDTFSQLANQSSDPSVVEEYSNLRNDYRSKINLYDDPVIKNLANGKVDDAAKAFIGTKSASGLPTAGKTEFNTDNLRTVLGDAGFTHFRNSVFENMMQNASDKNGFNPATFTNTWKRIADGTKSNFFGAGDPAVLPQNYVTSLTSDAKTAANIQKLTRVGVLGLGGKIAAGVAAAHPIGAGLTTALALIAGHVNEGSGGIAKGRELIDYVANNPKTWAAYRKIGAMANSPTAKTIANVVPKVAQAAEATSDADDRSNSPINAAQTALSGPALPTMQNKVVTQADPSRGIGEVSLPVVVPPNQ